MTTEDTTKAVLKHHQDSFLALDAEQIMVDYTDDSTIIMPTGTVHGLNELQEGMGQMMHLFTPENLSKFKILYQDVRGEIAYLAWTMGDVVPFGTDTFLIQNGKILTQTVSMYIPA